MMKYRFKALEKRRQPDQLDSPMLLVETRDYVAVWVVLITATFIGLWGFLGSIPMTMQVQGVLGSPGGLVQVQAPASGTLTNLTAGSAAQVAANAVLGTITQVSGTRVPVLAPAAGRVVGVEQVAGSMVSAGQTLLLVEANDGGQRSPLEAQLLIASDKAPYVRAGQAVSLVVPGVSPRAFGRLRGEVLSVSEFPLTGAEIARVTGRDAAAAGVTAPPGTTGATDPPAGSSAAVGPRLVRVKLLTNPGTVSGYEWTSDVGPPIEISSRTPVVGDVEIGTVAPVTVLTGS